MKLLYILILMLALSLNLLAQTSAFTEAKVSESTGMPTKWGFETGENRYEIKDNGTGKRTKPPATFKLPLTKGEMIEKVYFAVYKNDLVIVYGLSLGGDGRASIASFNSATLKLKWSTNISGFNVGQGLIENQFAYLTAIGFVSKLNLLTGKYVWKHNDLYSWKGHNGAFNSFELPELDGNSVIFIEKNNDNQINKLIVNRFTGKIIKAIL